MARRHLLSDLVLCFISSPVLAGNKTLELATQKAREFGSRTEARTRVKDFSVNMWVDSFLQHFIQTCVERWQVLFGFWSNWKFKIQQTKVIILYLRDFSIKTHRLFQNKNFKSNTRLPCQKDLTLYCLLFGGRHFIDDLRLGFGILLSVASLQATHKCIQMPLLLALLLAGDVALGCKYHLTTALPNHFEGLLWAYCLTLGSAT